MGLFARLGELRHFGQFNLLHVHSGGTSSSNCPRISGVVEEEQVEELDKLQEND